jgi:hypothetical protein
VGKRQTSITMLLAHIHAAYQQLQASLTTLVHNTKSQEHRDNIGVAQKDLDRWRVDYWSRIYRDERPNRKSQIGE